jgi:serine/threonine protein kinase
MLAPDAILQGRYLIVRQLGKGGMGAVYEAIDQRLDAVVALKETFSVDERLRRQFEQEARLLAQLHHPALPRVSDYFTEGDRAFLVMQFIAGVDLAEIMATQPGPLPRNQVIAWADQLLDALMYLHTRERQIIHRDIKPHNLKVTSNGQIALLDFGLAKTQTTTDAAGSSNSIFGYSRRYSPLEQIQDQGTSPQSDIYALGATLYHLLTGVRPQDALARASALASSKPDPLTPAHELHRAVGVEISGILGRAMALSAEDRYPTASDFRGALRRVGRIETSAAETIDNLCLTETGPSGTIYPTVVWQARAAAVDPFGGYSILKPDEAWLNPKTGRQPALIAAVLTILLMVSAGAFYGFGRWTEGRDSVRDYVRATPAREVGSAPIVRQSRAEKARINSNSVVNVAAPAADASRKSDKQKHPARRSDTARSKSPNVTPPPFSILP